MSDIYGNGWGDDHDWKRGDTAQVGGDWMLKSTLYKCANCGEVFSHQYDMVPDIFVQMKLSNISEHCPAQTRAGISKEGGE